MRLIQYYLAAAWLYNCVFGKFFSSWVRIYQILLSWQWVSRYSFTQRVHKLHSLAVIEIRIIALAIIIYFTHKTLCLKWVSIIQNLAEPWSLFYNLIQIMMIALKHSWLKFLIFILLIYIRVTVNFIVKLGFSCYLNVYIIVIALSVYLI